MVWDRQTIAKPARNLVWDSQTIAKPARNLYILDVGRRITYSSTRLLIGFTRFRVGLPAGLVYFLVCFAMIWLSGWPIVFSCLFCFDFGDFGLPAGLVYFLVCFALIWLPGWPIVFSCLFCFDFVDFCLLPGVARFGIAKP